MPQPRIAECGHPTARLGRFPNIQLRQSASETESLQPTTLGRETDFVIVFSAGDRPSPNLIPKADPGHSYDCYNSTCILSAIHND